MKRTIRCVAGAVFILMFAASCSSQSYNQQTRNIAEASSKAGKSFIAASASRDAARAEEFYDLAAARKDKPTISPECLYRSGGPLSASDAAKSCKLFVGSSEFVPKEIESDLRVLAKVWSEYFDALVAVVDADNSEAFGNAVSKLANNGVDLASAFEKAAQGSGQAESFKGISAAAANLIGNIGTAYETTRKTSVIKSWTAKSHRLVEEAGNYLATAHEKGLDRRIPDTFQKLIDARLNVSRASESSATKPGAMRKLHDRLREAHRAHLANLKAKSSNPFLDAIDAHKRLADGEGSSFTVEDIEILIGLAKNIHQSTDAFLAAVENK